MTNSDDEVRRGYIYGISCYLMWGMLALYFKALSAVGPLEVVAQRVVWSVLVLLGILFVRRQFTLTLNHMRDPRLMVALMATAVLIAINWLTYVWAVAHQHMLAASLGYFLNPLVSVALGVIILKEKLTPMQMVAVGFALLGVGLLAISALDTLWVAVVLAFSFGFYGLIRKVTPVAAVPGLAIETLLLMPVAALYLGWLAFHGQMQFGQKLPSTLLLSIAGFVTTVPLLLFAQAARRLPLASLGLLQYLAPSLQFLFGFLLFGEPLGGGKLFSFVTIWIGLAIFTHDALGRLRRREAVAQAAGE